MTHLGLVSGVAATAKGYDVMCFDPDAARVAALTRGELPISEPQLDELLDPRKLTAPKEAEPPER